MGDAVYEWFSDVKDVYRAAFIVVTGGQAIKFASDDPLKGFIPLWNGFHAFFIVHLHTYIPIDTPKVFYLTNKKRVIEDRAFNALFWDTSFLEIVAFVGL